MLNLGNVYQPFEDMLMKYWISVLIQQEPDWLQPVLTVLQEFTMFMTLLALEYYKVQNIF